jgi:uncharacterized membrane protein
VSRPRWVAPTTLGAAISGEALSIYLTVAHYTSPRLLACGASGLVNCERVTTSAQATQFGVPVAVLGTAWFMGMIAFCTPAAWRNEAPLMRFGRLGLASAGMVMALWLIRAELFVIGAICLWCTAVHVLTFVLFAVVVLHSARPAADGGRVHR